MILKSLLLVIGLVNICNGLKYVSYTRGMELEKGQVSNSFHVLPIPKGPIAVHSFQAEVVERIDGAYKSVGSYDAYLHHHVVGSNHHTYAGKETRWTPMKSAKIARAVGFGAGTESRKTLQKFYYPYAFLTVPGEDSWIANVHVINTRQLENATKCVECPCTKENRLDATRDKLPWNTCNEALDKAENTACFANTYIGGLRCCEDGVYCMENTIQRNASVHTDTYYLRYTIQYSLVEPEHQPLYLASCCDATGDTTKHGAIEYDIPKCDTNVDPTCIHTLTTLQRIGGNGGSVFSAFPAGDTGNQDPHRLVKLVFAVGHQHRGGMGITLSNATTGEIICESIPKYGKHHKPGDELGYVVEMTTCTMNPPMYMHADDLVRITAKYNSTVAHTGVMSLFYLALADVPAPISNVDAQTPSWVHKATKAFPVILLAAFILLAIIVPVKQHRGYQSIE